MEGLGGVRQGGSVWRPEKKHFPPSCLGGKKWPFSFFPRPKRATGRALCGGEKFFPPFFEGAGGGGKNHHGAWEDSPALLGAEISTKSRFWA